MHIFKQLIYISYLVLSGPDKRLSLCIIVRRKTSDAWVAPVPPPCPFPPEVFPIPFPVLIPCSPHTCDMFWSHQLPGVLVY